VQPFGDAGEKARARGFDENPKSPDGRLATSARSFCFALFQTHPTVRPENAPGKAHREFPVARGGPC